MAATKGQYRLSFGPWNTDEGADVFQHGYDSEVLKRSTKEETRLTRGDERG